MKVVEKFTSINGEGTRAGELAVFIRFKGCNLRCSYCDTMWANEPECPYKEETPEEILNYVLGTGIHNVTLTGGEPLMQKDIRGLIHFLLKLLLFQVLFLQKYLFQQAYDYLLSNIFLSIILLYIIKK